MSKLNKFNIPKNIDWLKDLPLHSTLNSKDVASIFSFARTNTINTLINKGGFPKPDYVSVNGFGTGSKKRMQWYVGTIRKEVNRRLAALGLDK